MARWEANLAALRTLRELRATNRPATPQEQATLAGWGGWGAQGLWQILDDNHPEHAPRREQLKELLTPEEYRAAARTAINAHYTDVSIAQQMWDALTQLGFDGGEVLEPGCGAGTFIGLAPDEAHMTGVELDPTTAAIAAALHPQATIRAESFAESRYPSGHFDAVIGNVPFGDITLHDPRHNLGRHSMHNHFIIKALNLTKPGGTVAVLTSHWTLDARNPAARREMHQLADLVDAIRLPTGAHRRAAGTEAITDLLIFRRRDPDQPAPEAFDWDLTTAVTLPSADGANEQVRINQRLVLDADTGTLIEQVLGTPTVQIGMHGAPGLHLAGRIEALGPALARTIAHATAAGLTHDPNTPPTPAPVARQVADVGMMEGHIAHSAENGFTVVEEGMHVPLAVPRTQANELLVLLQLRDQARNLLNLEASTREDTTELDQARAQLRETLAQYHNAYGPINRFTTSESRRVDKATGGHTTIETRRIPGAVRRLQSDPFGPLVTSLEVFDAITQAAHPAPLLNSRQLHPRVPVLGVDDPQEAIAISLDRTGGLDLELITDLLGLESQAHAIDALGDRVFAVPTTDQLVTRAEYLSGNVRLKLAEATAAAEQDPVWNRNVEALTKVLPPDVPAGDISASFGAVWIPPSDIQAFMREVLNDTRVNVTHDAGKWMIDNANRYSVPATSDWGTARVPAPDLILKLIDQHPIVVKDNIEDDQGKTRAVVNPTETEAAQEKAHLLTERLNSWLWEDPDRAARLQADYNARFNSIVLRDYTTEGAQLTFPGLARNFVPRPHQRNAVARMINEPSVGLFHQVGAGKTAEMIMGITELKRLGMVNKPALVVPNHMLEQFTREWLQLYPQAKIIALAAKDVDKTRRAQFLARVATNDWDGVIFTQTAFEKVPLSARSRQDYETAETERLLAQITNSASDNPKLKTLQKALLARQEKIKDRLANHDPGIEFEATGIDYLVVDEIHLYKNLATTSNITDAVIEGSNRAEDLNSKLHYLRQREGARVMTGATATPIANSITEMWVMQRYHAPEALTAAGITTFDEWAATFGEVITGLEANITGTQFKIKSRFAKFQNVPELVAMFHQYGDIKTAADLQLPVPLVADRGDGTRGPAVLTVPKTRELDVYVGDLNERVDQIAARQVDPTEDNMLKVASDGRKAALDLRLVHPDHIIEEPQKVQYAAQKIAQVFHDTRDNEYLDPLTGEPSPTRGALQIVFCDLSTPRGDGTWNVYDALREDLYRRGLPEGSVRFIHEARNDQEKGRLFAECRNGTVAVIIGSTEKMGVGTNIQTRAVHLVDMDAPWRPADVEQRHGRIIRQGNQNQQVQLTQMVTEGSFDGFMWQTLERKSRFINQIMQANLDGREMEDIASDTLSFAEFKAISTGNPLLMDLAQAENDLARLRRLETAHTRNNQQLRTRTTTLTTEIAAATAELPSLHAAAARAVATNGDSFAMTIGTTHHDSRTSAAQALQAAVDRGLTPNPTPLATLGGQTITAHLDNGGSARYTIEGTNMSVIDDPTLPSAELATGRIRRLENLVNRIPEHIERINRGIQEKQASLDQATRSLALPFKHTEDLDRAQRRYETLTTELTNSRDEPPLDLDAPADPRLADIKGRLTTTSATAHTPPPPNDPPHPQRDTGISM